MENTVRRSSRAKKISFNSSDNEQSEAKSVLNNTDEFIDKFSKLKTSTRSRQSQRLRKAPKRYQSISDHSESQNSESDKKAQNKRVGRSRKVTTPTEDIFSDEDEGESSKSLKKRGPWRPKKQSISNDEASDSEPNKSYSFRGKRGRPKKVQTTTDELFSDEDEEPLEEIEKPSEFLLEDQGVSGKTMFGFQRNKRRGGMAQKVFEAVNSPRRSYNLKKSVQNSPAKSKNIIREKMRQKVAQLDIHSSFEDFSDSGSEYKGSNSESEESESNSEEENNSDSDNDIIVRSSTSLKKNLKDIPTTANTISRNTKNQNYIMKSDDYFSWQGSSKIITSNHTLQKLKNPKLSEDQLQELLTSCKLNQSAEHEQAIHEMFKFTCKSFNKWMFTLHEGFNILLFGLGSKRNILKAYHKEMLGSSPTIVVNGYFPSLTIKDITDSILLDIFELQSSPGNVYEAVELIEKKCGRQKNMHLYIIVHNIDGPMLRNNKSQNILSSLANITNVHLLASIDHINTPLIWDHNKLSKFNFTWWDVTSFLPYSDETSFESSMLVQRSGALALSSLGNVYQSLTKNSKGIFMLIVKHQLKNKSVKYYQGMPFKVLYSQCREHFLVSSDLALRTQLTEFLDHKLVKSKRTADGVEHLNIAINNSLLQQFLDQHQT